MTDDLRDMPPAAQVVKDLDSVLPHFQDYDAFEKAFPIIVDNAADPCDVEVAVCVCVCVYIYVCMCAYVC
jgi:hypothetical protein